MGSHAYLSVDCMDAKGMPSEVEEEGEAPGEDPTSLIFLNGVYNQHPPPKYNTDKLRVNQREWGDTVFIPLGLVGSSTLNPKASLRLVAVVLNLLPISLPLLGASSVGDVARSSESSIAEDSLGGA